MKRNNPKIVLCPSCDSEIRFRRAPYVGQTKLCPDCDAEIEVVSTSPLEIAYYFDEQDYEYEEDQ